MSYPQPTTAQPKRLIICCDGTWQSSVSGQNALPSNITRLARLIALAAKDSDGKVWQQVVYYHAGVGTGALSTIEMNRQGATGDGLIINVIDCYNFVVNNYALGDQIFCFGFSRGAFTARAVAGLINDIGVLKPDEMQRFPSLFAVYKQNTSKHNFRKTREYYEFIHGKGRMVHKADREKPVTVPFWDTPQGDPTWGEQSRIVELVGVFDTVGSLGLADFHGLSNAWSRKKYQFLNVNWSPYIKHAFHALALDERRAPFSPSLFYIPNKETLQKDNEACKQDTDWQELIEYRKEVDRLREAQIAASPPDLRQVWFTGYHVNVGGGISDDGLDHEGLANITMAWMIEQCRPYLAFDDWALAACRNYIYHVIIEEQELTLRKELEAAPSVTEKTTQLVQSVGSTISTLIHGTPAPAKASPPTKTEDDTHDMVMGLETVADPKTIPKPLKDFRWVMFEKQDPFNTFYAAIHEPVARRPGEGWDQTVDPHPQLKELGETCEWVHPTVSWRITKSHATENKIWYYSSEALKGFEHTQNEFGKLGWHKKETGTWIPEWPIKSPRQTPSASPGGIDGAEVDLIEGCSDAMEVKAYLSTLMADWDHAQEAEVLAKRTRTAPRDG